MMLGRCMPLSSSTAPTATPLRPPSTMHTTTDMARTHAYDFRFPPCFTFFPTIPDRYRDAYIARRFTQTPRTFHNYSRDFRLSTLLRLDDYTCRAHALRDGMLRDSRGQTGGRGARGGRGRGGRGGRGGKSGDRPAPTEADLDAEMEDYQKGLTTAA
jgi:hypothetical protein